VTPIARHIYIYKLFSPIGGYFIFRYPFCPQINSLEAPYSPKLAPNIKYIYPHRGNIYFYPRASPSPLFAPRLPTICPSIAPGIRNIGGGG